MKREFSDPNHIELAMKSQRTVSKNEELWEREWKTIELFCAELHKPIEPGNFVLDVGCGGRELSWGAENRGLNYKGLDISDGNFEFDPFPIEDESVDFVIALALVEHLHNPDNFMKESLRVLRPGGAIIISSPNWRYSWRNFYGNPAHVQPYTEKSIRILVEAYGLENCRVVPGLRVKPRWMYFWRFAFWYAAIIPFRANVKFVPNMFKGKATSFFCFARKHI